MTNREASCVLHCPDAYGGIYGQKYGEALAHCFELLEKADNMDKIRAEIEQTSETVDGFLMHDETKRTILNIFDKYKTESEDKK